MNTVFASKKIQRFSTKVTPSPTTSAFYHGMSERAIRQWLVTGRLQKCTDLFVPVFTSGIAHWLLAHVQTKTRKITIYNSLRGFGQTEWLKPFRELFLPSLLPTAAKGMPFDIVYANIPQQQNGHDCGIFIPQQQNGHDCGIFVMAWLFHLVCGGSFKDGKKKIQQRHMSQWRESIVIAIKSYNQSWNQ